MEKTPVTFICTACGRPELLAQTLRSFMEHNTYPVAEYWVYEDSGNPSCNDEVKKEFPHVQFIEPAQRTGQIVAQDTLWSKVKTPYALAWEEDWLTLGDGFVEQGLRVLSYDVKFVQVGFRSPDQNNGHPYRRATDGYRILSTQYKWKGFSFAPSIKRLVDYQRIGSYGRYTTFNRKSPAVSEYKIGLVYWRLGYRAALLSHGYVAHIGDGKHVN